MSANDAGESIRVVSIAETDPAIPNLETEFAVEPIDSEITENHTARLRVTLFNQADTSRQYATGFVPPFPVTTDVDSRWMLVDSPWNLTPASETCWAMRGGRDSRRLRKMMADSASMAQTVNANESLSREYELWSVSDGERCMPTGTFRFEASYTVKPAGEGFTWGFSITVDSP